MHYIVFLWKEKKSELVLEYYRYWLGMTRIKQRTNIGKKLFLKKPSGLLAAKTNFNTSHILPSAADKQPNTMFYTKLKNI